MKEMKTNELTVKANARFNERLPLLAKK